MQMRKNISNDVSMNSLSVGLFSRLVATLRVDFYRRSHGWELICNGITTEWGPIRSVIIRVIRKWDDRAAGVHCLSRV